MQAHSLEAHIAHIEGAFVQANERFGSVDRRLDAMDARFNWVIGTIVGAWTTMIATQIGTILTILSQR